MTPNSFLKRIFGLYRVLGEQNPYRNRKGVLTLELLWNLRQTENRQNVSSIRKSVGSKGFGNLTCILESTKPHNDTFKVLGRKRLIVACTKILLLTPLLCDFIQNCFIEHLNKLRVDFGPGVMPVHCRGLGEGNT